MKKIWCISLVMAVSMGLVGCATQKVTYKLDDTTIVSNSPLSSKTVALNELKNELGPYKGVIPRTENRAVTFEGIACYINSDSNYKDKNPVPLVTAMMAEHLNHSALFKSVTVAKPDDQTDYILEGSLMTFEGFKESSGSAKVGAQFGLIGALVTSGVKSKFMASTALKDIKLIRRADGKVLWTGDAEGDISGEDYADAYGWSAYLKANESLKIAVNNLIAELKDTLDKAVKVRQAREKTKRKQ